MYDMKPDKNILEVVIDTPYGTAIEEIEVPGDITDKEAAEEADTVFLNACNYSFRIKEADDA